MLGTALLLLAFQDLSSFEKTVTERRLENGMSFLIVERHEVPVVSFHLYADVGSVDEEVGQTGMAHMFEHMAFKGTPDVGTRDYPREKEALDRVDEAYRRLREAKLEKNRDAARIEGLEGTFRAAAAEAGGDAMSDELPRVIEQGGGSRNLGRISSAGQIQFGPANQIQKEEALSLESARFL